MPVLRPIVALGLLLAGSCRTADVASANLDQLMGEDNSFRYSGNMQSGVDYLLRSVIDPSWFGEDSILNSDSVVAIENPTRLALDNLLALRKGSLALSGPFLEAERVRQFTRYAAFCPSALCRERAFLELAPHAARLQVPALASLDRGRAANAPELAEGLRGLRSVLVQLALARDEVDYTTRRDFEAACALLGRFEYDIEGGRRLLRVIAAFGELPSLRKRDLEPLLALSLDVQRRVVALALVRGRYDPSGAVRAAAFRANYAAHGDAFLQEALLALVNPRRVDADGVLIVSERFHLVPEIGNEPEPYEAVFELMREHGLPGVSGTPADAIAARLAQLHTLMQVTHDFSTYPDRIRALAMSTLGEVSGADLHSLREEEWGAWWTQHRITEGVRLQRAEAAEVRAEVQSGDGG